MLINICVLIFKKDNIKLQKAMKQQQSGETPIYKKIQNYIFKFSDLLGQGNFSKVYRAHHELTNEVVAIKIVQLQSLKSKKLQELLFSEIDVLKKLNHPNVLKCHEVFTSNRNCYIITQLCNQGDLQSRLRKDRYFDQYKAEPIIKDIFQGLYYLAQKNVIHRDLKVTNVFIHNSRAKIADFGFAKFTKEKFKDINIGSPIYMSPEGFINNIYGPKTDVWAFGVMIYELLHGQTPFSECRTETELKQSLSMPITKSKFKSSLSHEVKDIIMRCMEIDEAKRISIFQLASTPYFRRLLGIQTNSLTLPSQQSIYGSANQLRDRSPSYTSISNTFMQHSDNVSGKRRISIQKPIVNPPPQSPKIAKVNIPTYDKTITSFSPSVKSKNNIQRTLQQNYSRDKKQVSSSKQIFIMNPPQPKQSARNDKSIQKSPKKIQSKFQILSGILSFKECVNILHYGRLIFKFLMTLTVTEYANDNELFKLSKWLMELLSEINQKIEKRQITYDGDNAVLRQQKLKEVRNEYQKKYRLQLSNYTRLHVNFGQQNYTLDFIKNYCYNIYQKYDSLISKQNNKSLIMLGHCIIMMCDTTKILKRCYEQSNYNIFLNYKDVETFLNLPKEQIDMNSYLNYRKKMVMYY